MSVDIGWETITAGPDGAALAEKIRAFVHRKFQQVTLPRFISSVHVHSFELGTASPEIEIKDICDPLPDFYEDEEEDEEEEGSDAGEVIDSAPSSPQPPAPHPATTHELPNPASASQQRYFNRPHLSNILTHPDHSGIRHSASAKDILAGSADLLPGPFPRSTTPGIPGGTSNLSYFHFPGGGLSGTQTPLAAVASGTPFSPRTWSHDFLHSSVVPERKDLPAATRSREWGRTLSVYDDPSTRPSTVDSISSPRESESGLSSPHLPHTTYPPGDTGRDDPALDAVSPLSPSRIQSRQPSDLQVVARVKYSGDVRMTLTAEILLDYPMPSFVGIPLKLAITGMTFDGVAIVASIKRKMHFCFLDPEDAAALVGESLAADQRKEKGGKDSSRTTLAGLLKEIHVESEIGRQEDGKQVLKNVGKVEKFVLEQVRKIFEEEFVFPSYWTFLV